MFLSLCRSQCSVATVAVRAKHTLPQLEYDYKALEPIVSAEIMEVRGRRIHCLLYTYLFIIIFVRLSLSVASLKTSSSVCEQLQCGRRAIARGRPKE